MSFGTQETQLIWTRFAGFITINGFLINSALTKNAKPVIYITVGLVGLFLNTIWYILNFSGWQNQNIWYYKAHLLIGEIETAFNKTLLPTDYFDKLLPPWGSMYYLTKLFRSSSLRVAFTVFYTD